MGIIWRLVLLLCAVVVAICAVRIQGTVKKTDARFRSLLAFLEAVHIDWRKGYQDERNASGAFRKTVTDTLGGCRNSIDAIRSAADESSVHRRDTVEVRAPLNVPMLESDPELPAPTSFQRETTRKPEAT